ncbi:MAG: SDR family oxidoreductase [Planctomycetales bacterium]|nr:SDR family oxidoreductase [Planctomycetales bacterium]
MSSPRVLITGGLGCIGSETAKWLIRNTDAFLVIGSRSINEQRIQRVFDSVDRSRMSFVDCEITDQTKLCYLLQQHSISHVVHLAALQTPDCNAHRHLGLQVNLGGTQNLIEAMKACKLPIQRYVYASSIAVYGPRDAYAKGTVAMLSEAKPVNVYGAWKLASEHISKFFWQDTGTTTVCLRPGVLYGPGRDAGLTSSPTTAIKSVALGQAYQIPFCSRQDYLFAPDVGAAFAQALLQPFEGFGIFTLPSHTVTTDEFLSAIQQAAREAGIEDECRITVGNEQVPFICDLDYQPFTARFPDVPHTSLSMGVRASLDAFREQVKRGWLVV